MISRLSLIVSLAAVINASPALAQTLPQQTATIPFGFTLEGTGLPAGTYRIEMTDSMVLFVNTERPSIEGQAGTLPLPSNTTAPDPKLIFASVDSGYLLLEIHTQKARRLVASEYGHPQFNEQQLRTVPITAVPVSAAPDQSSENTHSTVGPSPSLSFVEP